MTEQSNALRLADWLEDQYDPTHNQEQAAAELRRLVAQRDLLLRTLKDCEIVLRTVAKDDEDFQMARQQVRDVRIAIKKVEG